ncbi:MAG: zinc ribbon domain-containing protein [Cyanobacteria bacterium P01_A01_bin.17]
MSTCPRCNYSLQQAAVSCPQCGTALTAYGHPGIPLHQAQDDAFLCATCVYDLDDTCTFPQRPRAKTCTLYKDSRKPRNTPTRRSQSSSKRRYDSRSLLWLLGFVCLVAIAILLAR